MQIWQENKKCKEVFKAKYNNEHLKKQFQVDGEIGLNQEQYAIIYSSGSQKYLVGPPEYCQYKEAKTKRHRFCFATLIGVGNFRCRFNIAATKNPRVVKIITAHNENCPKLHQFSNFSKIPGELEFFFDGAIKISSGRCIENLNLSHFYHVEELGCGGFGSVAVVAVKETAELYACKVISRNQSFNTISNEKSILQKMNHSFIINIHSTFSCQKNFYINMELALGGTITTILQKQRILEIKQSKIYVGELVCALQYIHNRNIIHRDVKPDNMLIDAKGHLKLADFGLATEFEMGSKMKKGSYCK